MAISKIGGTSSSDNYELISSVTPTSGAAAVNFTSLSGWRRLLLVWSAVVPTGSGDLTLRLNNDSTNKYFTARLGATANVSNAIETALSLSGVITAPATHVGYILLSSCDNTGVKLVERGAEKNNPWSLYNGFYLASASISQVNVITSGTFQASGTVSLYGAK